MLGQALGNNSRHFSQRIDGPVQAMITSEDIEHYLLGATGCVLATRSARAGVAMPASSPKHICNGKIECSLGSKG